MFEFPRFAVPARLGVVTVFRHYGQIWQQRRIHYFQASSPSSQPTFDLEDTARSNVPLKPKIAAVSIHQKKRTLSGHFRNAECGSSKRNDATPKPSSEQELLRPWRAVLGQPPNMGATKEEKLAWLAFMKRKWTFQKRQRADIRNQTKKREMPTSSHFTAGVSAFVQRGVRTLLDHHWQIIQVMECGQRGLFVVWVLVNDEVRQVKVRVPRIFYINQLTAKDQPNGETYRQVQRFLPRGNRVYNLYEYRVDEKQFQQQINQLQAELSAPHVEGIYESQVPLSFRLFAQVGCVCKVADSPGQAVDSFDIADLEFLSTGQCKYLENGRINYLYLYHYTQDTRCMVALFFTSLRKAHVFIGDKSQANAAPSVSELYTSERSKRSGKISEDDLPPLDVHFETVTKASVKEIYSAVQRLIKANRVELRGATVINFESPLETQQLLLLMPALDEFPFIKLRVVTKKKLYSTLDWQRVGARHMINGYLHSKKLLKVSLELSRYLHVPVGNVPEDPTLFGADLFFARYLWKRNHVLWCSPTERPDFGGKEVDDNRLVTDTGDLRDSSVNRPRLYDSVCFELDIASVPVTALLQAQRISEFEGVSGASGFDVPPQLSIEEIVGGQSAYRFLSTYDETARCAGAFRVLKTVVHDWVNDIINHHNVFADNQIIHFYRWLCTSSSLLYDPALKRTVNGYMKKLILLLTVELKRLGATVVFASLSRIIVCTNKLSSSDALGYVNFVTQQLQRKDVFSTLDVTVIRGWKVLMWLDPANFGGITFDLNQQPDDESEDNETPLVDMNWNMMHFLPNVAGCQINFKILVAGYIVVLYQRLQRLAADRENRDQSSIACIDSDLPDTSFGSDLANVSTLLKKRDPLGTFRQELLAGELSEKLFLIVDKIKRAVAAGARDTSPADLFPLLPGHHLKLRDPALEFAKAVCKALSLDHCVEEEVARLKTDLLKLVGVSEFADEAQWVDPCLSYVLKEVICRNCNYCRDVDLCRDPYLLRENLDEEERPVWRCIHCHTPYEIGEIEHTLISHMNSLSMSYVLQDMKCGKCKQVKQANMNIRCECGGEYVCTMPTKSEIELKLKTFASIASYYNMKNLQDALQWAMER